MGLRFGLNEFRLGSVLAVLMRSEGTIVLEVRSPDGTGAVQLYRGSLHHAVLFEPMELEGIRALDYLLGLRQGEAETTEQPLSKTPTLHHNLVTLGEIAQAENLWQMARHLPNNWSLVVTPSRRVPREVVAVAERLRGKTIRNALLLFPALPSRVGWALSVLHAAGAIHFTRERSWPRFPFG